MIKTEDTRSLAPIGYPSEKSTFILLYHRGRKDENMRCLQFLRLRCAQEYLKTLEGKLSIDEWERNWTEYLKRKAQEDIETINQLRKLGIKI